DSEFDAIFNCTYSNINNLLNNFNNKKLYLKQELTELCIVNVPEEIKNIGITLMCGPFFSILPSALYKNNHCFSHVRYTPHFSWEEKNDEKYFDPDKVLLNYKKNSLWENMKLDGNRYIPIIKDIEYIKSIWEIKTILPKSEVDDSRPILFIEDKKKKNFFSVLGGKIDNVYDALNNIDLLKI
ncbi:amino acid oxidase, partial [Alphaproteobacteria bacterium]|nr:amino acid oxidase [Alphaproteobacteria bacterium]